MRRNGARVLPVSAAAATAGKRLLGGPLRIVGYSLNDGAAGQGLTATGQQTAPGAGATIASISLPNGEYTVEWTLELQGTPGAGEVNNVALDIGATQVATSVNLGAVGNYPQQNANVSVTGGPLTLAAKAIGAGTAGAIYIINFTITPTGNSQCTLSDGGMVVATISVLQGADRTEWPDTVGLEFETDFTVTTTQGVIQGTVFYYLEADYAREPRVHEARDA